MKRLGTTPPEPERATAGIDRWRDGWVVAEQRSAHVSIWHTAAIAEAIERLQDHAAIAIDMPIALAASGRRSAEAELRAVLGSSARSVFTSPTRRAVSATTQDEATRWNRETGGPGISAQAFGLFASIRELRAALVAPSCSHWWETHPETAFAVMNGGQPLATKKSGLGVAQRLDVLRCHFPTLDADLLETPAKIPVDDVLDAIAALWSAQRIAAGIAVLFGPAERDDEGFALGIRI